MSDPADTLKTATETLAQIRRRLESGKVDASDLPAVIEAAKQAYETGQSVLARNFQIIDELQQAID